MKIRIRDLVTGNVLEVGRIQARVFVAIGRAEYADNDDGYGGKYMTRHMEASVPAKARQPRRSTQEKKQN